MKRRNPQPTREGKLRTTKAEDSHSSTQSSRPQPQSGGAAAPAASSTESVGSTTASPDNTAATVASASHRNRADADHEMRNESSHEVTEMMRTRKKKSRDKKGTTTATASLMRSCHIDRLCKDELHIIMHFLTIDEILKLARSRFHSAASTPIAWRYAHAYSLIFDPNVNQADVIRSSSLIHSISGGIEVQWNTCDNHTMYDIWQQEVNLMLAIPNIRELWIDGTWLRKKQWDQILTHSSLAAVTSIRIAPDNLNLRNLESLAKLPALSHLCVDPGYDGISCFELDGVHQLPHLTSLTIQQDTSNGFSCTTAIEKCQHLSRLDIGRPQFYICERFREFFTSTYICQLETLTIRGIELRDFDPSAFIAAFSVMHRLHEFEYTLSANSLNGEGEEERASEELWLTTLTHAPQLHTLRLRLDYDERIEGERLPPSRELMSVLIHANPKLQIEVIDAQGEGEPKVTSFNVDCMQRDSFVKM